jgi:hypothetical protein
MAKKAPKRFCHGCQLKRGGVPPKGHGAITCSTGTCSKCKNKNVTLVPTCDYDWPKTGKKAVFD